MRDTRNKLNLEALRRVFHMVFGVGGCRSYSKFCWGILVRGGNTSTGHFSSMITPTCQSKADSKNLAPNMRQLIVKLSTLMILLVGRLSVLWHNKRFNRRGVWTRRLSTSCNSNGLLGRIAPCFRLNCNFTRALVAIQIQKDDVASHSPSSCQSHPSG